MRRRTKLELEFEEKYGSISLSKYLSRFANVGGRQLNKLTHSDVQELFPNLRVIPLDELSRMLRSFNEDNDRSDIFTGRIILVDDGKSLLAYYGDIIDSINGEINYVYGQNNAIEINDTIPDCASLNEYSLRQLLRRKFNSSVVQYVARKELKKRGIPVTRKYKRDNRKYFLEEE